MSGEKTITEQISDYRKMWAELWWKMADGDVTAYKEIKKLEVMEFWGFFDRWRERITQRTEQARAGARGAKK